MSEFDNEPVLRKLTPEILSRVQTTLQKVDFADLIRRQSVCVMIDGYHPQRVFDEVWVEIKDLKESIAPDVDLFSDPWLFQHLTETFDKGVLKTIVNYVGDAFSSDFSLNLNVSTVLSDAFLAFDNGINANAVRSSIIIEINWLDALSDIKYFMLAKTLLQHRGYKVCLDGVPPDKLKYLNTQSLDVDMLKIIWSPEMMDMVREDDFFTNQENKVLRRKFVLCRVDDCRAIEVGNSIGINLYQGRYIQKLLYDAIKNNNRF